MLSIIHPDYASNTWEDLPGDVRAEVRKLVSLFSKTPEKGVVKWLEAQAESTGIAFGTLRTSYYALTNNGGDWTVLVDKKKAPVMKAEVALSQQPVFAAELCRMVASYQRKSAPAFRALKARWAARKEPIPGYEKWPGWPKIPAGWSDRNLARIVEAETNAARLRSIRVGTSSKTNAFLPTVLTTRVGLWPGAVIQIDDVWHDNLVVLGKKKEVVRVIELGALDLFSAHRFHWGAKPRRKRENGTWETIAGKDTRMFIAGLLHSHGYSPNGCMFMSENNTAKIDEDIARILYDSTGGKIRVDYQPIEGKQAALSGYWAGTEGGNFRAKAALESLHNRIHNDLAALAMQTGSPSSGLLGPVTTERQAAYIAKTMGKVLKEVPHRAHLLKLPTLDFHMQFLPLLTDYYHFGLACRSDHDLEGWARLGHIVTEYCSIPGGREFMSEEMFLTLPETSQMIIREGARQYPKLWTNRRSLSPLEVWERREKFLPVPPVVIAECLGDDLAREVTSERGYLSFADQELTPDKLIYKARYSSGPNKGREIPHGETVKMFALPFDDTTALLMDARNRFLGEVPLFKRILPIDPEAFNTTEDWDNRPDIRSQDLMDAAAEKHSRIADILEPERILHSEKVTTARDLREHNKKVISGKPVTPEEIAEARSQAGHKGQKTAAANRLHGRGEAPDWDAATAPAPQSSAWDDLPDDEDIPEAL